MKIKYYIIGIAIIVLDQVSKFLMINNNITIIQNILEFNYTKNTGGAFGIGRKNLILILSIIIIVGLIIFLIKEHKKIKNYMPFVLILFGSIGNLIDRIFRGYVIDFINIKIFNFPIFNIADICIVIGVFLLIFIIISRLVKK